MDTWNDGEMLSHWKRYTAYSIFTGIRWSFTHSSVSARENGISFLIVRYSLHPPVTLFVYSHPCTLTVKCGEGSKDKYIDSHQG